MTTESPADLDSGRVTLPAETGTLLEGVGATQYLASGFLIVTRVRGQLAYLVGQERDDDPAACTTFSGLRQGRSENVWRTAVREMREETVGSVHLTSLRTVAVTFRRGVAAPYVLFIATIASRLLPLVLNDFARTRAALLRGDLESAPYFVTRRILRSQLPLESALFPFLEMRGLAVVRARDFAVLSQSAGARPFTRARFHAELQTYLTKHLDTIDHFASARPHAASSAFAASSAASSAAAAASSVTTATTASEEDDQDPEEEDEDDENGAA